MQGETQFPLPGLGERLVKAARLAVAVHLFEASQQSARRFGAAGHTNVFRQRVVIGGAGPSFVTDDAGGASPRATQGISRVLPPATGRSARPSRVSRARHRPFNVGDTAIGDVNPTDAAAAGDVEAQR